MSYNSFGKLIMIFLNYPNKIFVFIHSNLNLLAPNHIIETNVKGKKKKKFWIGREDDSHNWTIKAPLLSTYNNYHTYSYTIKL